MIFSGNVSFPYVPLYRKESGKMYMNTFVPSDWRSLAAGPGLITNGENRNYGEWLHTFALSFFLLLEIQ